MGVFHSIGSVRMEKISVGIHMFNSPVLISLLDSNTDGNNDALWPINYGSNTLTRLPSFIGMDHICLK